MFEKLNAETLTEFDRQNAECEAFLLQSAARAVQSAPLIHKTLDSNSVERQPQQAVMSEENARAWHAWADEKISSAISLYDKTVVVAHDQLVSEIEAEFRAADEMLTKQQGEIEALRTELAALRADVNIVQAITRGEITSLKAKSTDAA